MDTALLNTDIFHPESVDVSLVPLTQEAVLQQKQEETVQRALRVHTWLERQEIAYGLGESVDDELYPLVRDSHSTDVYPIGTEYHTQWGHVVNYFGSLVPVMPRATFKRADHYDC